MEKTVFCGEKFFRKPLKWAFLKLEFFLHVIFITFTRLPHMTFMKVRKLDSFNKKQTFLLVESNKGK